MQYDFSLHSTHANHRTLRMGPSGSRFAIPHADVRPATTPNFSIPTKAGELLQGVSRDGSPILVTATTNDGRLPVFSKIDGAEAFSVTRHGLPAAKAESVVRRFAALRDLDLGLAPQIDVLSGTPIGKGRASSSQDQQRALLDIAAWFNIPTTVRELYGTMCSVERSDFLFCPNRLIHADPVGGDFCDLGPMPTMAAVVWDDDPNGMISTSAVAHLDGTRRHFAPIYEDLVVRLADGAVADAIAVSTASAAINQAILPKRTFEFAARLAARLGGGVIVAHTGTIVGVLLPPEPGLVRVALADARAACLSPMLHSLG